MAKKNIADMNDEEFMAAWDKLGEEVEAGKAQLREFSQEHQKRTRLAQLNLEPGDIELLQSMTPEGIKSAEAVMTGDNK